MHSQSSTSLGLVLLSTLSFFPALGCNSDHPGGQAGKPNASLTISVIPPSISVRTGTSEQFRAEVTGSVDVAVSWWVNGLDGGSASLGTITQDGLYTAPMQAQTGMRVTVMAMSHADPSKSGTALVEIIPVPGIALSPLSPYVAAGGRKQFTATVVNVVDAGVNWSVDGVVGGTASSGIISDRGLYLAPLSARSARITATSVAAGSASASTDVSVLAPHSVGVRTAASGMREFFLRTTGATVQARKPWVSAAWATSPRGLKSPTSRAPQPRSPPSAGGDHH